MSIHEYALQATESHIILIDLVKMTTGDTRDITSLNKLFAKAKCGVSTWILA